MSSVLITGANRGIGLEFARQYAADGWHVHATARAPAEATGLAALAGAITLHPLDAADVASVRALKSELGAVPIDLLINNAGVYGPRGERFGETDYEAWDAVLRTNLLGAYAISEALADNLAASERKLNVAISSRMGSLALLSAPAAHIYNTSKAGLNMAMRCLSAVLAPRGITTVIFTPGHVRTDMGGPSAPLGVEESVAGMRAVIERLSAADNGRFFDPDGEEVPW